MTESERPRETSWIRNADPLISIAAAPAFAEIRNLLVPLGQNLDLARLAARELRTASEQLVEDSPQLSDAVVTWVEAGRATSDELVTLLGELESVAQRLQSSILAIEKAAIPGDSDVGLEELFRVANELAHHGTKLIGGVEWPSAPHERVAIPRAVGIGVLAAALTKLCTPRPGVTATRLEVHLAGDDSWVEICITTALERTHVTEVSSSIAELVSEEQGITIGRRGSTLVLRMRRSREPASAQ
jgi:hypothetical protein